MPVSPVRLAVVGANDVVARGLAAVVAEFPDRVCLLPCPAGPPSGEPEVVLYDAVALHAGDGHDLDALVRETSAAVLVLAREPRPDLTACALAHGADGWVSLEADAEDLVAAIEAAAAGQLDDTPVDHPSSTLSLRLPDGVRLSARELEMLTYITQDLRNSDIAERCYLSVNSVKTYIRTAYRKIGVSNRSQAVLWCIQHGLLQQAMPPPGAEGESGLAG